MLDKSFLSVYQFVTYFLIQLSKKHATFGTMNIEEMNEKIMQGSAIKIERNETIRGSINHMLIASLREYWTEHGFPTEQDYINHRKTIRVWKSR